MRILLPLSLALTSLPSAFAQQVPNAGSELQRIQSQTPTAPVKKDNEIRIDPSPVPAAPTEEEVKIKVRQLKIIGTDFYTEEQMLAVTGFIPDTELSLTELRAMSEKIAEFLRSQGEFVAQAYLAPQDIEDGVVQITVLLGQYGKMTINNQSRLKDDIAQNLLKGLSVGDKISSAPLEKRLLLLSDLPGISVKSTLSPGASAGSSNLVLELNPGQSYNGTISADNQGNRYSGANRVDANLNINEPAGLGDVASIHVMSAGAGLNYGRAAYQVQLGQFRAGLAYSDLQYQLGKEFASAQLSGSAQNASVYGSYPLLRSRPQNLTAQLAYDNKSFIDKRDSTTPGTLDEKKAQVLMASLNGNYSLASGSIGAAGQGNYSLSFTRGNIELNTPSVLANDALSAQSNGKFSKLSFNFSHRQTVLNSLTLYASINGQLASKNLDSSEKIGLGGADGVRAYPSGEVSADQGYQMTFEARKQLQLENFLTLQLVGFIDTGSVSLNKNPWPAITTPNRKTLSAAGLGINWISNNNLVIKAYYAFKLGNAAATSAPDASGRFWLQAIQYF